MPGPLAWTLTFVLFLLMIWPGFIPDAVFVRLPVIAGLRLDAAILVYHSILSLVALGYCAREQYRNRQVAHLEIQLAYASHLERSAAPSRDLRQRGRSIRIWDSLFRTRFQVLPLAANLFLLLRIAALRDYSLVAGVTGLAILVFFAPMAGGRSRRKPRWRCASRSAAGLALLAFGTLLLLAPTLCVIAGKNDIEIPMIALTGADPRIAGGQPRGGSSPEPVADMSFRDLAYADLRGVRWAGATLAGTSLRHANLGGADFSGVRTLSEEGQDVACQSMPDQRKMIADFSFADLSGATLIGADLRCAQMRGANLTGANLEDANLLEANLAGARLDGARLSGAILNRVFANSASFRGAILHGASLNGTSLVNADLRQTTGHLVSFVRTDLTSAILDSADLRGAMLVGAELRDASMKATDLRGSFHLLLHERPGLRMLPIPSAVVRNALLCKDFAVDRAAQNGPQQLFEAEGSLDFSSRKRLERILEDGVRHMRDSCPGSIVPHLNQIPLDPAGKPAG